MPVSSTGSFSAFCCFEEAEATNVEIQPSVVF